MEEQQMIPAWDDAAEAAAAEGAAADDASGDSDSEGPVEVQMDTEAPLSSSRKRKQQPTRESGDVADEDGDGGDGGRQDDEEGHCPKVIRLTLEELPSAPSDVAQQAEVAADAAGIAALAATLSILQSGSQAPAADDQQRTFYPNPQQESPAPRRTAVTSASSTQYPQPQPQPQPHPQSHPRSHPQSHPQSHRRPRPLPPSMAAPTPVRAPQYSPLQLDLTREESPEPDEEYACPVCRDLLVRPVTLDCGHTCCQHCLIQWVDTKQQERNLVTCPAGCQQVVPPSVPGVNVIISSLLKQKYPAATAARMAATEEIVERWHREQQERAAQREQRANGEGGGGGGMDPLFMVLWIPLILLFQMIVAWGRPRYRGRIPSYARLLVLSLSVFQWTLVLLGLSVSMTRFGRSLTSTRAATTSLVASPFNIDLVRPYSSLWASQHQQPSNLSYSSVLSEGPVVTSVRILANMDAETLGQVRDPVSWAKRLLNLWSSIWGARALAAANPQVFVESNITSLPNMWDEFENPAPHAFFRAAVLYQQPFLFALHTSGRHPGANERAGFLHWYEALFRYHMSHDGSEIHSVCARHISHVQWATEATDMQEEIRQCARTYTWLLVFLQYEPRLALLLYLAKYVAVNTFSASRIVYLVATRIMLANLLFLVRAASIVTLLIRKPRLSTISHVGGVVLGECLVVSVQTLFTALFAHLLSFLVQPLLLKFPLVVYLYWDMFQTMVSFPIAVARWNRLSRADQQMLANALSPWWHDDMLTELELVP